MPKLRARPTVYLGVEYRSTTEASFARFLRSCGDRWTYEPRRFLGAESGDYLPDFYITPTPDHGPVYVEIKPHYADGWLQQNRAEVDGWLARMLVVRQEVPEAVLALIPWDWEFTWPRWWLVERGGGWLLIDPEGGATRWGP